MGARRLVYGPGAHGAGPLDGLRVLDLARLFSGDTVTATLGDLGADVVKIEQPGSPDPLRESTTNGYDAYWRSFGRNKRAITLNLKSARGRELLLDLVERGDVLVENFRPGVIEQLGLGPDVLLQRNPRIVVARISGWGQTGPWRERPGFGTLAEAVAGFTLLNGYADRPPLPPPLALGDSMAALYTAVGVLAAVCYARSPGGQGQVVDVSLFEPLFSMMGADSALSRIRVRSRGEGTRISSVRGVFETSDGKWVALSAATDEMVGRLFSALELNDLLDDPRYATYTDRIDNRDSLNAILAAKFAKFERNELLALAEANRLTIGPLYGILDQLEDGHFAARETIVEMLRPEDDNDAEGTLMHNVVPRLSLTPGSIRLPAPAVGEHNREILGAELGLSDVEIDELARDGTI